METNGLTESFSDALQYVSWLHARQVRKGTKVPYLAHLLAVSSLVMESGGTEEEAIAALLHDAIEDQPNQGNTEAQIKGKFGGDVLAIVKECTKPDIDWTEVPKADHAKVLKEARLYHMAKLKMASKSALMVMAADKLHNARSILADCDREGAAEVFERFRGKAEGTVWYYENMAAELEGLVPEKAKPLVAELKRAAHGLRKEAEHLGH